MSARVRVVVHCRAGRDIGMGHAVRLGALLREFPEDYDLTCCVDADVAAQHFPASARFLPPDRSAVASAVREGGDAGAFTILVVDLPRDAEEFWSLGGDDVLTVAVDDHGGPGIAADVVVNQGDIAGTCAYPDLPAHAVLLAGTRYAMVRPAFSAEPVAGQARAGVGFVAGSGERSEAWIRQVVDNLDIRGMAPVRIVVSSTFSDLRSLARAGEGRSMEVRGALSAEGMADFYRRPALCVMTGGMAIFEAMAMAAPVACYPILDDMVEPTRLLSQAGALVALPRQSTAAGALEPVLRSLLGDVGSLQALANAARGLVDGAGCARVAALVRKVAERRLAGQAKREALFMERPA